jgi:hypothetical protein
MTLILIVKINRIPAGGFDVAAIASFCQMRRPGPFPAGVLVLTGRHEEK